MTQQEILHAIDYVVRNWPALVGYGGLATFISVVLQYFKKRYHLDVKVVRLFRIIKLDGPRLVASLYTIGVSLATGYTWLLDPANAKYVPDRFAYILTFGFFVHRFLVSPAGQKLERTLEPYLLAVKQIKAMEAAKASLAATPSQQVQPTLNPPAAPPL